jgi:glycosyltransferase involved in cell wall biosynthesis
MFETLQPGQTWAELGFFKCITTSETQKTHIEKIMRKVSFDILSPVISECFVKNEFPPKTIISIHTRDQRDTANIIKQFYARFPQYRWITFRDLRGLTETQFSEAMKDSFLSIWIDPTSSFGTFPLEAMKMNVPVIGVLPHLQPEWLNEDNGLWLVNKNSIVDVAADFVQNWLEDNVNPELYEQMEKTASKYSDYQEFQKNVLEIFSEIFEKRSMSFEEQLNKLETIE